MASAVQQETVGCNLCGSTEYSRLHVKHGYTIVRCNQCRLVFLNPRPVPSDLASIYNEESYYGGTAEFENVVVGYADYLALRDHLHFVVKELLLPLKGLTPGVSLDVGCSMGLVMDEFRQRGWIPHGVDVSSYATEYARTELGLDAFTGTIDQVDLPPESVDLATMLLTIEHIPDPKSALRSVRQLLKPGGILIVATHDVEGVWPRLVGPRWRHYNMPEHIYYFSRRTLTQMLSEVGFQTFRVAETPTLAAVTEADATEMGLYAPVRLLHKTHLLPVAAPGLRAMHGIARSLNLADGITTYSHRV